MYSKSVIWIWYIHCNIYHAREICLMLREMPPAHTHTYTLHTLHTLMNTSLARESSRSHHIVSMYCAQKVNRRGKRKLPVILTGAKVQPPTTMKTTKKLENPRSAATRLVLVRSRRKRSNGTSGSYRRSFTRMHNYPVSWRTSSTGVSISLPSRVFFLLLLFNPRRAPSPFPFFFRVFCD